MFSKTVIVVDKDVDVQNEAEVAWIVGTHYDPERDIQFTRGPVDDLEDASDLPAYGSKMGIDATRKWPSEGFTRPWPKRISHDRGGRAKADDDVGEDPQGMEGMTPQQILETPDLIAVGVAGDDESAAAMHGARTTFVRVFEMHVDAPPAVAAAGAQRGRDSGSSDARHRSTAAVAAVRAARRARRRRRRSPASRSPICWRSPARSSERVARAARGRARRPSRSCRSTRVDESGRARRAATATPGCRC